MHEPIDITIVDPRSMDGDPYDVAERAVAQAKGLIEEAMSALGPTFLMLRNADMERNMALGNPPAGDEFLRGPQGRKLTEVVAQLTQIAATLSVLQKAAAYNPKHPPKA